ncbi:MAG: 50S ribosomal protein L19 [bacterium]
MEELKNRNVIPGMVVRVHEKIQDISPKGEPRERIQIFEGIVIGLGGKGISRTATVRKDSKGWMVEKIFPLNSPNVDKIEVVKQYRTRRAKLTFLRGKYKKKLREVKSEK